ncbi:MAG TPA: 5-oxoprolinase subunit PxpB [Puia sp.]|nr:5-oxoprolinase subunit PxpB [Puia sp.]
MESKFVIFPIGDNAVTIDLGNHISESLNRKVLGMQQWLSEKALEGVKDLIVAYSSLTIFYDPVLVRKKYPLSSTVYQFIKSKLEEAWANSSPSNEIPGEQPVRIPVCYDDDFGFDLDFIAEIKGISKELIIQMHLSKTYRVYMIGFLPGFSYLGELDEKLILPRKRSAVPVPAGSVGIAGSQTGIYPLNSPGGWHIIGRTPFRLFNPLMEIPVTLKPGNYVQFYSINREEFNS